MQNIKSIADRIALSNGYGIPCLGYGTWQTPDGATARDAVKKAIETGFRHIDAAAIYGNEESVGEGIAAGGVDRSELFVTGKVWNTERGYDKTIAAFEKSLKDLKLDYLDLYLIHWPASPHQFENYEEINADTWRAMIDLYKSGKVKAIGVSNFWEHHLKALLKMEITPMVNQIEFHPGQMQQEVVDFSRANGMVIEAYSPLGNGRVLSNETLQEIAKKYDRSAAQICLRWVMQNGVIPLSKSVTPERIEQNAQVFDFEISEADMATINDLPYIGGSGDTPDTVDF